MDGACDETKCVPRSGKCVHFMKSSRTQCDDGDPWTKGDHCDGRGKCLGGIFGGECMNNAECAHLGNLCAGRYFCEGSTKTCKLDSATTVVCAAQNNPCRTRRCTEATGTCESIALPPSTPCDDKNAHTIGNRCDGQGTCLPGKFVGQCQNDSGCAALNNLCSGSYFCNLAGATCQLNPSSVVVCPTVDNTACLINVCQPASDKCVLTPSVAGQPCDASDIFTQGDHCDGNGNCLAGKFVGQCRNDSECLPYEDGIACNGTLFCDESKATCKVNPATVGCPSGKKCDGKKGCN
jgi:hypothetical protein